MSFYVLVSSLLQNITHFETMNWSCNFFIRFMEPHQNPRKPQNGTKNTAALHRCYKIIETVIQHCSAINCSIFSLYSHCIKHVIKFCLAPLNIYMDFGWILWPPGLIIQKESWKFIKIKGI